MQGILFFDRMSDEVLDSIRTDLQVKQNFNLNYVFHTQYLFCSGKNINENGCFVCRIFMSKVMITITLLVCLVSLCLWTYIQALEKKYEESTGLPSPERIEKRRTRKAAGFGKS